MMRETYTRTAIFMDTFVQLRALTTHPALEVRKAMDRAFEAFRYAEQVCNRFDPTSEVRRLSQSVGEAVSVSDLLFEAVRFAREVAEITEGAFDPTIGHTLERQGFNTNYITGETANGSAGERESTFRAASYRDVGIDAEQRTITLHSSLLLDLGAVAKGLAMDLAVRELQEFEGFAIDAGGDVYVGGEGPHAGLWHVGVRHPQNEHAMLATLRLTDAAVCTSGSYERPSPQQTGEHHLIDPRTGRSQHGLISCTVVAPFAMMADAFSTAAFILGAEMGSEWLEQAGLGGLLVTPAFEQHVTNGMKRYLP